MLAAKTALDYVATLLAASDDFTTIDPEAAYSEDEAGQKPIVELHISNGYFSSKGSAYIGDKMHRFTIQFSVIASSSARYDLSVLENAESTDEERATAIEQGQRAANRAYSIAFTTFQKVFDIIYNRENLDFGLPKYAVKHREFGEYKIDRHITSGNLATVFGNANLEILVTETVSGATPVAAEDPVVKGVISGDLPD